MTKKWQAKGDFEILAKRHNKYLISQTFENLENPEETIDWTLFKGGKSSSIIFALTKDLNVLAIKQYRFGVSGEVTEVMGGNIEKEENGENAALRELEEETGFRPEKLMPLSNNSVLWIDPVSIYSGGHVFPWLAIGCVRVGQQKLDPNESIKLEIVSLDKWIFAINEGVIKDCKTIAMTFLALSHLGLLKLQI